MNTDAADHVLGNDQYRDALNLRYIDGFKNICSLKNEEIIETTQVG